MVRVGQELVRAKNSATLAGVGHQLQQALALSRDVLIAVGTEGDNSCRQDTELVRVLAQVVRPYAHQFGAMILTGGDTARAMLDATGVNSLRLVGEVEPGVAIAISECTQAWSIVTKAGAFGSPDTLVRAHAMLRASDLVRTLKQQSE